jgi:hypothetical protein
MKIGGLRKLCIVFSIILVILTSSSLVVAQPQKENFTKGLFHLQFVSTISWSGSDLQEPISPGETREVNLTITSIVTRGAYGKILLHILEGATYIIQLSIVDEPDWCTAWTSQENLIGVIVPDEVTIQKTQLYIHLSDDAPSNYTLGWVKIRCNIENMKGPLKFITLIGGFEQNCTLTFVPGP